MTKHHTPIPANGKPMASPVGRPMTQADMAKAMWQLVAAAEALQKETAALAKELTSWAQEMRGDASTKNAKGE